MFWNNISIKKGYKVARPGITESEVFEAIENLLALELKITVVSIREHLQRGSPNTINRHLRTWKKLQEQNKYGDPAQIRKLRSKNLALQADFKKHQQHVQELSEQLLDQDRKILQLKKEFKEKEQIQNNLEKELHQVQLIAETMTVKYEASVEERKTVVEPLLKSQQEQISQFSQDLQAINIESLKRVREIGMAGQDKLLEEKIKVKELTEENKVLQIQIKQLQKELEQTKNLHIPLQNKIKQQEKLIANCLDPNKMSQLKELEEELNDVC